MIKERKSDKIITIVLVAAVFIIATIWALSVPGVGGPDEPMRYKIVEWLYKHPGQLPRGDAKELLDPTWGISYAFYPIFAYMVAAVFVSIGGIFTTDYHYLIPVARMASVLFITLSAWFVIKIAKRLFKDEKKWLFSSLVIFLPGYMFMGTYVNNDALSLWASTIILLAWVRYLDEGWTWKNCGILAAGMGICFLSYYNAYGWILCSFFFYCITSLFCDDKPMKERVEVFLKKGLAIAGITFLIAGWWFVRNFMIYDGDFLARKACSICAELNASPDYKPSVYKTPHNMGWTLMGMFLCYSPDWGHNWFVMVIVSFIGTFGMFDIFMNETVSKIYMLVLGIGVAGMMTMLHMFDYRKKQVTLEYKKEKEKKSIIKTTVIYKECDKKGIFHIMLAFAMIIPVILLVTYSYYSDFQAQGRYIMSAIYPIMYFVTCGYGKIMDRFVKKEIVKKIICWGISAGWLIGLIFTYIFTIIPGYQI